MIGIGTRRGRRCCAVSGIVAVLTWPGVERFGEGSFEDLHDAVCIGVVVDWRCFARRPDENQLYTFVSNCFVSCSNPDYGKYKAV